MFEFVIIVEMIYEVTIVRVGIVPVVDMIIEVGMIEAVPLEAEVRQLEVEALKVITYLEAEIKAPGVEVHDQEIV